MVEMNFKRPPVFHRACRCIYDEFLLLSHDSAFFLDIKSFNLYDLNHLCTEGISRDYNAIVARPINYETLASFRNIELLKTNLLEYL